MAETAQTKRQRPRLGGGKRKNRDNRKERRRQEAQARQTLFATLTPEEQTAHMAANKAAYHTRMA